MQSSFAFRQHLILRILRVTGAGSIGLSLLGGTQTGCGASVRTEVAGGQGGAGQTGASGPDTTGSAMDGSGGNGGNGGGFVVTSAGAGGGSDMDAGSDVVNRCVPLAQDAGACPEGDAALIVLQGYQWQWCKTAVAIVSGPVLTADGMCCYDVVEQEFPCYVGRTFFIDEGAVKAELRRGGTWGEGPRPDIAGIPHATRGALADAWARDGLFEHASVASFSRFSMQLLAVGAPADLVRDTHAACIDEVRHAELCLALASAYRGEDVEPAWLPFPAPLSITPDLAAIAAETVMEGCIGETVAAIQAYEALQRTTDPAVRQVLQATVEDETRHAELAWRFVAWALSVGGPGVREAIIQAFAGFRPPAPSPEHLDGVCVQTFAAHGRIPAVEARAMADRALREIVGPCLCALLSRDKQARPALDSRVMANA
jgi:hypothetical protein